MGQSGTRGSLSPPRHLLQNSGNSVPSCPLMSSCSLWADVWCVTAAPSLQCLCAFFFYISLQQWRLLHGACPLVSVDVGLGQSQLQSAHQNSSTSCRWWGLVTCCCFTKPPSDTDHLLMNLNVLKTCHAAILLSIGFPGSNWKCLYVVKAHYKCSSLPCWLWMCGNYLLILFGTRSHPGF